MNSGKKTEVDSEIKSIENGELNDAKLDGVTGGSIGSAARNIAAGISADLKPGNPREGEGQGGQSDPAQMFQQILQQLTQGQG